MRPEADLSVDQLTGDVHPVLHRLRSSTPVVWVPAIERWLVTDRQLVLDALRDVERFTVADERFTTAQVVGPSMLSLDGDEHARHRDPFAQPFRRSASLQRFEHRTREIADELLAALSAGEPHDLRAALAAPLAAITITEALGLVDTSTDELLGWYGEIVTAVEAVTAGEAMSLTVHAAFDALAAAVARSTAVPGTPMSLIDSAADLSPAEFHSNTAVMLFGAIETSEGMTANALHHVLSRPQVIERLLSEPDLIPQAVEESLRLEPAATLVDRYTTEPVQLGDVMLPARAAVSLSLAGANRDPAYFDEPDRFDLDRANASHHLSFVHGPHACIGMHLARLETTAALSSLLDRSRRFTDQPDQVTPTGLIFRKPESVVSRWDVVASPEPRR